MNDDLPLAAGCLPILSGLGGSGVDPQSSPKMSQTMEKEIRRPGERNLEACGLEFNVNSPTQLAEILF